MFSNSSRTARSGTDEYPTPRVLVERMVAELIAAKRWSWVSFETKPDHFVQVAHDGGDDLEINVSYRYSEDYQSLFARHGLSIPNGWRVNEFKKKGWLSAGTMLLVASTRDIDSIAQFTDRCFKTLYGEPEDYKLNGVLQS